MKETLHERFASAAEVFWPLVADHLWQATLVALVVFVVTLVLSRRRVPAGARHTLWLIASAKFVVPSAVFALLARLLGFDASILFGTAARTGQGAPVVYKIAEPLSMLAGAQAVAASKATGHNEIFCVLTLLWLTGCAALLTLWWVRRRAFLRALGAGRRAFEGREFEAVMRARTRLHLKRDVTLLFSPHRVEPGVWRTRRPVVVLPERIAEHLNDEELEAVVLHELVHVERRDNLVSNFQMALCCVFWFHPLVWLISRRLVAEREQACDERVLEVSGAVESYASGILKVVRFCCGWKMAGVSGAGTGSNLRRRIENIMNGETRKLSAWHRSLLGATVFAAVVFSIGTGLFSHALSEGVRAQESAGQSGAGAAGGSGKMTKRIIHPEREPGEAVKEIMRAPETSVRFENPGGAPLIINDAKMRSITREQLKRAMDEGADYIDDEEDADQYLTLPSVMLTNNSGKRVREVGIGFASNDKTSVVLGRMTSIRPGEAVTLDSRWFDSNAIMPGDAGNVLVTVVWVQFEDGTQWGGVNRPRPPQPPEPPAPESNGASSGEGRSSIRTTRTLQEDEGATAEGSGGGADSGGRVGAARTNLRGQLIDAPNPSYPPIARAARAQGTVTVEITVDENGKVIGAKAVSGHPLLQTAAVDAAREARFKPTFLEGKPVRVSGVISYVFALPKGSGENQ